MKSLIIGGKRDGQTIDIPLGQLVIEMRTFRDDQPKQTEIYEATIMQNKGVDERVFVVQGMLPEKALERFKEIRNPPTS